MFSSDLERRVLAHLPAWAADEKAFVQAELDGGAERSVRSYTAGELHARLVEHDTQNSGVVVTLDADSKIVRRPLELEEVTAVLDDLKKKKYATLRGNDWRMTKAGLTALTS